MKFTKLISLFMLSVLCLGAISGCGGDSSTTTDTQTDPPTEEITTEAPEPVIKDYSKVAVATLFEKKTFTTDSNYSIAYGIYVPEDYDAAKTYPLVVFLHGAGERGNDNVAQYKNGIGELFKKVGSPILDCIVIAPQCPTGEKWVDVPDWKNCIYSTDTIPESKALGAVVELIGSLPSDYSIDSDRIYATGLSMGGYGTWDLLVRHGDMFAAAIPVCGGSDSSKAELLVNIPIKTFHGKIDPTVPSYGTRTMVSKLSELGGTKLEYTEYPQGKHNIWTDAYSEDGLAEWLLSHKLSDRK